MNEVAGLFALAEPLLARRAPRTTIPRLIAIKEICLNLPMLVSATQPGNAR